MRWDIMLRRLICCECAMVTRGAWLCTMSVTFPLRALPVSEEELRCSDGHAGKHHDRFYVDAGP